MKKDENLIIKLKALRGTLKKNRKQAWYLGFLLGSILASSKIVYEFGDDVIKGFDYFKSQYENSKEEDKSEYIANLIENYIFYYPYTESYGLKYFVRDNYLYDIDGNIVNLNGSDTPLFLVSCDVNKKLLENIELSSSKIKTLCLDGSNTDNGFVDYLPNSLEELSLVKCHYITNLNKLPDVCPNLYYLSIDATASLSDLSFIYKLSNLKELHLSDSAYVTQDLLNYLRIKNITTNLTEQDVKNSQKIDEIIDSIITPDMSEKEKIQAVCMYVLDNVEYDYNKTKESNQHPLGFFLEEGTGVCSSYAYLTTVLLNKAGIESYKVRSDTHAWNLVRLDDKYYYIDTTNMDNSEVLNYLLKKLNICSYYMIDPESTFASVMRKPEDDKTVIPMELIDDIKAGTSEKDLFEKYSGQIGNVGVIVGVILCYLIVYMGVKSLLNIFSEAPVIFLDMEMDYYNQLEEIKTRKRQ